MSTPNPPGARSEGPLATRCQCRVFKFVDVDSEIEGRNRPYRAVGNSGLNKSGLRACWTLKPAPVHTPH